jgi:hypothetical protein
VIFRVGRFFMRNVSSVMDDLGCPVCDSRALVYPRVLEDDEPVECTSCGAFVSTYGDLKRRAEQALDSNIPLLRVSGC